MAGVNNALLSLSLSSLGDEAQVPLLPAAVARASLYLSLPLELHHRFDAASDDMLSVQRRVADEYCVVPPLPEERFLCAFGHIFAGGYAAGYYS